MLYLGDYSLEDIAHIAKVDIDTVRFYVFGENGAGTNEHCWHQIKKKLGSASVAAYVATKQDVLEKTAGLALNIVTESLKRIKMAMDEDPLNIPTFDDVKKLSGIVMDMDKMVRLESGQATQITEHVGLTRAEAIRVLKEDPFAQDIVDEVEWFDIEEKSEEKNDATIEADISVSPPWKKSNEED